MLKIITSIIRIAGIPTVHRLVKCTIFIMMIHLNLLIKMTQSMIIKVSYTN